MGRILIVDDSSTVRLKLRKAVAALGHESLAVEDGPTALATLREQAFDTVLLDILMPGMDGFEVLEHLKADPETKGIPVIVISALSETMGSVVRAMDLGAEDFLPKDFALDLLKSRLTASVEKNLRRVAAPSVSIRGATAEDIPMLLSLINTAGGGIPLQTWRHSAAPGQGPWDRGRALMLDPAAAIHIGNCWIAETRVGGLGAMVIYPTPHGGTTQAAKFPEYLAPDEELEAEAHGTAHVAYLCTVDSSRGQGIGSALLRFADDRRTDKGLSLVVASANYGARALYQRHGFSEVARRAMLDVDGKTNGQEWILMLKG